MHLIVRIDGKPIEVQVRTSLQHVRAELSEKLADITDPSIKYGGGPTPVRQLLDNASAQARFIEDLETTLARVDGSDSVTAQQLREIREKCASILHSAIKDLNDIDPEAPS